MRAAIDAITVLLLVVGCFFVFLGSFSLVKLSSFFHRIHGPTKSSTLGVGCILLASMHFVVGVVSPAGMVGRGPVLSSTRLKKARYLRILCGD